ncbi:MAG: YqgE/AlgH family protein [Conchiformibius sp.]|nr:YqgE/AlgH family protein [Conchiformibius sp.]
MNLTNHFLIAMPDLGDGLFSGSVVYVCEHNDDGAMGVIINKPSPIPMDVVFAGNGKSVPERFLNEFVLMGGPVQPERGFVVHTPVGAWMSSLAVGGGDNAVTTSRDIIDNLADTEKVEKVLLTIGYASWSKGQLEKELADNAWLTVAADNHILFDVPAEQRYQAAFAKLGVERVSLMNGVGHA